MQQPCHEGYSFLTEKKEQVVETTCGSHEKTSRDNFRNPGKLPVRKFLFPRNYLYKRRKIVIIL
jgi:hypothetical protein